MASRVAVAGLAIISPFHLVGVRTVQTSPLSHPRGNDRAQGIAVMVRSYVLESQCHKGDAVTFLPSWPMTIWVPPIFFCMPLSVFGHPDCVKPSFYHNISVLDVFSLTLSLYV